MSASMAHVTFAAILMSGSSAMAGTAQRTRFEAQAQNATGYLLGLGVEHKYNDRWSVTGEWEYQNYGKQTIGERNYTTEVTPDWHQIKIGLNHQF